MKRIIVLLSAIFAFIQYLDVLLVINTTTQAHGRPYHFHRGKRLPLLFMINEPMCSMDRSQIIMLAW